MNKEIQHIYESMRANVQAKLNSIEFKSPNNYNIKKAIEDLSVLKINSTFVPDYSAPGSTKRFLSD